MNQPGPALELREITKQFPGVIANDGVNFSAQKGEIHALLGENGAGKSTLMSILCGLYQPDEGTIFINGQQRSFQSPRDAIQAGIGMVYQHFMLVPSQSVAENILLGMQDVPFHLNLRNLEDQIHELSQQYGLAVDPLALVWQLSVGEQQRVEILKMLYRGAEILILDEPTAVLTPQEIEEFCQTLRGMSQAGKTIIFISHKLDEVLSIADRITVLRHGRLVQTVDADGISKAELASMMVGREVLFQLDKEPVSLGEKRLMLDNVEAFDDKGLLALRGISFNLHAGEILGIAGVAGNGQRELTEVITGMRATTSGTIEVSGQSVTNAPPTVMIEAGIACVPEDRSATGSAPNLSVAENLALRSYSKPPIGNGVTINRYHIRSQATALIEAFEISTPNPQTPARKLSGGNLQKLILAREISANPQVLIASSPTRGLDIGATENVRRILLEQRSMGTAILLISEDLDEIFALCDRVAVIFDGVIMGELPGESADLEAIGLMMAGEKMSC
ncbi:ABC transporter ATP-binding protein [Chloroflexi bacterium TSY]|nr:ABC transporter ATP-binding protein [Chloroflexi bacterium TSY]